MTREERLKEIERIEKLPRKKRWRAAVDYYLKLNPTGKLPDGQPITAKAHYMLVVKENLRLKNEAKNKTVSSKGGRRLALSIPRDIEQIIRLFDPQLNLGDDEGREMDIKEFGSVFPEFRIGVY